MTSGESSPVPRASRRGTSSTCVRSPKPGRTRQLCSSLLHKFPGSITAFLLDKVKDLAEREWYVRKSVENGWSRSVLVHWIESDLYSRQGKAQTNFERSLPPPQSDLARETLKDPYKFEFLSLAEEAAERELEEGLLAHIRKFLIELGAGFAFVGQQVHLEIGGEDFFVDLLFYHLKLRAYVVIDLKTTGFQAGVCRKDEFLPLSGRRPAPSYR